LYGRLLGQTKGIRLLGIPEGVSPNYWFYSLLVDKKEFGMDRSKLMDGLTKNGIQSRPLWYLNHWQRPYHKNQAYKIEKALKFWEDVLNLPCSTNLTIKQIKCTVSAIRKLSGDGQE
jgi:perosamine synthetase